MAASRSSRSRGVRFARALALTALASPAGCASMVTPHEPRTPPAETPDATDTVVGETGDTASFPDTAVDAPIDVTDARPVCDCCPTGDWSGRCMQFAADAAVIPPQPGHRWCIGDENVRVGCPIEGPLAPPELTV